jgi:hypothetical protein
VDGESRGSDRIFHLPAAPRRFSPLKNPDNVKCSFFGQGINSDCPGRACADDGNALDFDGDHACYSPVMSAEMPSELNNQSNFARRR